MRVISLVAELSAELMRDKSWLIGLMSSWAVRNNLLSKSKDAFGFILVFGIWFWSFGSTSFNLFSELKKCVWFGFVSF